MKKAVLRVYLVLMTLSAVAFLCAIPRVNAPQKSIDDLPAAHEETSVPVETTPTEAPELVKKEAAPPHAPQTEAVPITSLLMPVNGEVITTFSKTPIYSETMGDWRAHLGIDIRAPKTYRVYAAAKGTITKVYTDPSWGITVEIEHAGALRTVYKNLSTDIMAKEGDNVEAGDAISGVGDSAAIESALLPHLHFEVYKDGEAVDPQSYFN
ncbi:MAG: M23 family metallopeptidase [Clostridia bacterium]|nr:M23 family metallopeptidase [Clostridia bacterium]